MNHYVHHVPGRLRVRTPAVKGNATRAADANNLLQQMQGVTGSAVNTLTGSIVINYDLHTLKPEVILHTLHLEGYVPPTCLHELHNGGKNTPRDRIRTAGVADKVGDAVANKLVEFVLERSALALIAALL
jgi:hypothetical protein